MEAIFAALAGMDIYHAALAMLGIFIALYKIKIHEPIIALSNFLQRGKKIQAIEEKNAEQDRNFEKFSTKVLDKLDKIEEDIRDIKNQYTRHEESCTKDRQDVKEELQEIKNDAKKHDESIRDMMNTNHLEMRAIGERVAVVEAKQEK